MGTRNREIPEYRRTTCRLLLNPNVHSVEVGGTMQNTGWAQSSVAQSAKGEGMDKLLALQTFAVVADTGGFSKAARQLGTVTSSVTRLMDALEASLGVKLLTRT